MKDTRYLYVGGGMTGDAATQGIREHDPDGSIVLVGSEAHAPYKRPPLTKGLWSGGDEQKIWRGTADRGVDLGHRESELRHGMSLVGGHRGLDRPVVSSSQRRFVGKGRVKLTIVRQNAPDSP